MKDEDIINIADSIDDCGSMWKLYLPNIAAVLRDYVRMRRLANAVKTVAIGKDSDYHKVTEIERLLAEAESRNES